MKEQAAKKQLGNCIYRNGKFEFGNTTNRNENALEGAQEGEENKKNFVKMNKEEWQLDGRSTNILKKRDVLELSNQFRQLEAKKRRNMRMEEEYKQGVLRIFKPELLHCYRKQEMGRRNEELY